ncbi:MAG: hypothetical protein IV086_18490 [Hyphomonadaceae bacterium]|nr:MAG: hypothetical protein FD160_3326 [Caulobacteraceae bacterium]MBT9447687.1 hypothetical protein [Hyphomonadaceae bacterium]TPW06800.1 MAG: hypothetical protein FD124_1548 [Alphaproteobacteria bacterium]
MNELVIAATPYALLAAGILALLLSTRQWALPVRLLIWGVGAGFLITAILKRPPSGGAGIDQIASDALQNWNKPDQSILAQILAGNWVTVSSVAPPMFDVATTVALVLAVIALLAFTPGETIERLVRPFLIGLLGAFVGGLIALGLVASGLAGYQKDRVYVGVLADVDVHDGDTLKIGEVSIRLNGIDAPEKHQECIDVRDCAEQSRRVLSGLVDGALVICTTPAWIKAGEPPTESFGRPILDCSARREGKAAVNLSETVIASGAAVPFRNSRGELKVAIEERPFRLGCMLRPHLWRNSKEARARFEARSSLEGETAGCPPRPQ